MIKIENYVGVSPEQMEFIIQGMRNPMNSWEKSDSYVGFDCTACGHIECDGSCKKGDIEREKCYHYYGFELGQNDFSLMQKLIKAGTDHRKFMRMIPVYIRITAPLYWWKEFDTYKVGTVSNSCSTMHKIQAKEFTLNDFSIEHLKFKDNSPIYSEEGKIRLDGNGHTCLTINLLNYWRNQYLNSKSKDDWWQMIQLLPSSYNQTRNIMMNYEVLANIYKSRKNHKLDEWKDFCKWIESLPYSELITHDIQKEDIQSHSIEDQETIKVYGQQIPKKDIQNSDSYSDAKFNGEI